MSILNNSTIKSKAAQQLVVLSRTRTIEAQDEGLPEWDFLKAEYESPEVEKTVDRLVVTVANACITQRRVIFCLTRADTQNLLKNDKNWSKGTGFKHDYWPTLKKELYGRGIIVELQPGSGQRPGIYELVIPVVLSHIIIDRAAQLQEAHDFVNRFRGDDKGDNKGDRDLDLDKEEEGEREQSLPTSLNSEDTETEDKKKEIQEVLSNPELRARYELLSKAGKAKLATISDPDVYFLTLNKLVNEELTPKLNWTSKDDFLPTVLPAVPEEQKQPKVTSQPVSCSPSKAIQPTPQEIYRKWVAETKRDYPKVRKEIVPLTVSSLLETLKKYGHPVDSISPKKIAEGILGMKVSPKIVWLVEFTVRTAEDLIALESEVALSDPKLEEPQDTAEDRHTYRPTDFASSLAYKLWHTSYLKNGQVHQLGGSEVEYYNHRAYADGFRQITNEEIEAIQIARNKALTSPQEGFVGE